MPAMAVNVTNRFRLPEGVRFKKGTKLEILFKRCERQYRPGTSVIELFFIFIREEDEKLFEIDTVLNWSELPKLYVNRRAWEKVRQFVATNCTPDEAYINVAAESLVRGWRFEATIDLGNWNVDLIARRSARSSLSATIDHKSLGRYLHFDQDSLNEQGRSLEDVD